MDKVTIKQADADKRYAIPVGPQPRISGWDAHIDHVCDELVICLGIDAQQFREQIDFAELWHMIVHDFNFDALVLLMCRHGMAISDLPQHIVNRHFVVVPCKGIDIADFGIPDAPTNL